jgi:poly(3-hydroxybutyrate) depolymerase
MLASLSACLVLACKEDPLTHSTFTAVSTTTPTPDAMMPPPSDGGSSNVDAGPRADGKTSGCGMDPNQPNGSYFEYHMSVSGPDLDANMQPKMRDRRYYVRLPANYDQTAPNRVVYIGPGCGGNTATEVLQLHKTDMDGAILVAVMPLPEFGGCFDETVNSVEYPFFDALHKKIESSFCVDPDRQFYAGFSTGARLGYMLDCVFPDVLRATATIQGALPPIPPCKKHPIAMIVVTDTTETGNPYAANVQAAQRVFGQNGCTGTFINPMPPTGCGAACSTYDTGAAPLPMTMMIPGGGCMKYAGCPADYPIVFCSSTNEGHDTYERWFTNTTPPFPWSDQAFWNFFKQF